MVQAPSRILVVANHTCPCSELIAFIEGRAGADTEVVIVAPALNSRLAHWLSDTDAAVRGARARVDAAVEELRSAGIEAQGVIGDGDPLVAVEDTLAQFAADEIVIATWPPGRSHWLETGLVENTRSRYGIHVEHVVTHYGVDS